MSSSLRYLHGFGNHFESEALAGALPQNQNSPQVFQRDSHGFSSSFAISLRSGSVVSYFFFSSFFFFFFFFPGPSFRSLRGATFRHRLYRSSQGQRALLVLSRSSRGGPPEDGCSPALAGPRLLSGQRGAAALQGLCSSRGGTKC